MIKEKERLIHMCSLVSSCIRDYDSLLRQYKELIYDEKDLNKPVDDKMNLMYRYNALGIGMLSQRMVYIENGLYLYIYRECLLVVVGNNELGASVVEKVCKYIHKYVVTTSNTCPTVIWCTVNVYIEGFKNILNSSLHNVSKSVYHDIFILGKVTNCDIESKAIRNKTYIALEEERVSKKKRVILKGYGFSLESSTLFEYLLTTMNRVSNY